MLGSKPSFRKSTFFNLKVPEKNPQENNEKYIYFRYQYIYLQMYRIIIQKIEPCFFLHMTHFFIFEFAIPIINLNS